MWKLENLNSNIEIHKYFLYIFPTTYEVYLNSNIEIHKFSFIYLSTPLFPLFKF